MKKIILPLFMIAAFMLTSCRKKTYVCYCTEQSSGQKTEMDRFKTSPIRPINNMVEKDDFKASCEALTTTGTYGRTCGVVKE